MSSIRRAKEMKPTKPKLHLTYSKEKYTNQDIKDMCIFKKDCEKQGRKQEQERIMEIIDNKISKLQKEAIEMKQFHYYIYQKNLQKIESLREIKEEILKGKDGEK